MTSARLFSRPLRRRGGLLITAMIFAAVIAVSLVSFLRLATATTRFSYRSFYAGASMNVAETGLEQAMWGVNKRLAGNTTVWSGSGWSTQSDGSTRQTFDLGTLSGGARAQVKVFVSSANLVGATPYIIARSIITPPDGPALERWVRITLTKRSRFSTGLVAKDVIRFSGNNASVDSYDSRLGAYNASLSGGARNKYDRGSAGSASVRADTFNLGNADIWGYAVVGTSDASGLNVGSQGTVGPFGTASGTVVSDHVSTDFTANFDDVAQPGAYSGAGAYDIASISNTTTLPRATDTPAADGKYYYNIGSISLSGNSNKTLTIADKIVIRMTPATGTAISLSGQASLVINDATSTLTPSLEIFTSADVDIGGNGVAFSGKPKNFMLWGTRPQSNSTPQSISIVGNGVLSAVVYAPNSDISINGGGNSGDVFGSMVGKTVTVTGNGAFHYDESLADLDTGEPMGLNKWNELITQVDRTAYSTLMNF